MPIERRPHLSGNPRVDNLYDEGQGPSGSNRMPRDLMAGGRKLVAEKGYTRAGEFGTVAGPVTTRQVDPATTAWPHRCTICGARTHPAIDCPREARARHEL